MKLLQLFEDDSPKKFDKWKALVLKRFPNAKFKREAEDVGDCTDATVDGKTVGGFDHDTNSGNCKRGPKKK